jgi:hypothetical protein
MGKVRDRAGQQPWDNGSFSRHSQGFEEPGWRRGFDIRTPASRKSPMQMSNPKRHENFIPAGGPSISNIRKNVR